MKLFKSVMRVEVDRGANIGLMYRDANFFQSKFYSSPVQRRREAIQKVRTR